MILLSFLNSIIIRCTLVRKLSGIPYHRRMSQRAGGAAPHSAKAIIFFGQKQNFSERSQQPRLKKYIFLYLLNKKLSSFRLARNPGFLLTIPGGVGPL